MWNFIQFVKLCFYFAHREAWRASFGYASPAGGGIVSGIGAAVFPSFMANNNLIDVVARGTLGGLAGWGVVFLIYLIFFAPKKALSAMRPVILEISNQISSPEMTQNSIEKHAVYIKIKNKSPLKSLNFRVFIAEIPGISRAMPWQIYSGAVPREDEIIIQLADWFIWPGEREIYEIRVLAERPGAFAEASEIQIPQNGANLKVLVKSHGFSDKFAWCRIFVDQKQKRLVLKKGADSDAD